MIDRMRFAPMGIGRSDVAVAFVASVLGVLLAIDNPAPPGFEHPDPSVLAIPAFVAMTLPLLWRRVAPVPALAAWGVAAAAHVVVFGAMTRCGVLFPIGFLFAYTFASRFERGPALLGLAAVLGIDAIVAAGEHEPAVASMMSFIGPITLGVWAGGRVVRSRARLAVQLEARTAELRDARDERARLQVETDRARLSSELDALLQRRLGELATLADEGGRNGDAGATLARIEHESRRTLEEMRAIVGVLRNADDAAPVAPQPTLTHLEALLVRAKGADARLRVEGSPRALPAGVELSAYRIVEQLLQALKDAPGVEVGVRFGDDALELRVAGPARRRSEDAIERARERVRLHDGRLEASSHDGRAEALVRLPVYAAVQ